MVAHNACMDLFNTSGILGGNTTRVDKFSENIFLYMQQNVALLNIFIKEPYCIRIGQEIKFPL